MKQHGDTFSSGQSLIEMDTVADRLAPLSFHHRGRRQRGEEREGGWKQKRGVNESKNIEKDIESHVGYLRLS